MQIVTPKFPCETPEIIVETSNFERLGYVLAVSFNIGLAIFFTILG